MTRAADHLLRWARAFGLFAAARLLTSGRLRILGYHGVALSDEWAFQPMLFMRPETFRARLEQLWRGSYPVLTLTEGLECLRQGTLPKCAVVITIDDGWFGTYRDMAPALEITQFPRDALSFDVLRREADPGLQRGGGVRALEGTIPRP
jgi:hypothetical protein